MFKSYNLANQKQEIYFLTIQLRLLSRLLFVSRIVKINIKLTCMFAPRGNKISVHWEFIKRLPGGLEDTA